MPYEIRKSVAGGKPGYRVFKKGTREALSKEALPYDRALAQFRAVLLSELRSRRHK